MLPATCIGIVIGFFALDYVTDKQLKPVIGIIVLLLLGINYWRTKGDGDNAKIPTHFMFAVMMGLVAGVTTMMANAAGPIMIIYLLAMRAPKIEFVGTAAWFFFIVNWLKVPFSASLNLMTAETVKLNLTMLPFILIGSVLGAFALKKIPQKGFTIVVQVLTVIASVKLILTYFNIG